MLTGRLSTQTDDRWIEDDAFCTSTLLVSMSVCIRSRFSIHYKDRATRINYRDDEVALRLPAPSKEACPRLGSYCAVGHTVPDAGCDVFA